MKRIEWILLLLMLVAAVGAWAAATLKLTSNAFSLAFGQEVVGSSKSLNLVVTNSGHVAGPVGAIILGGVAPEDYSIGAGSTCTPTLVLAPGESCSLEIVFSPRAVGARNAELIIGGGR